VTEGVLRRWSRRKLEAAAEERAARIEPAAPAGEPPPELPPVETLGADSDYTAFLAQAVPEELQRLALRRAWASDPKISAFRGFAEYDWDCNAAGYAALLPIDDVARLCDAVLRPAAEQPATPPGEPEQAVVADLPPQEEPCPSA
jgi:Protein of unknown function (DUF3306)